ncbi:LemA family protein [Cohnella cellulosilytica]|uniref:LemA family protein n=1 Tax=Cohnella cellulosilytica TaxID=986710 RepID=A0ABW2FF21_9BACL
MMQLLKRRRVAWTITLIVVLSASMLGASLSLGGLRADADASFVNGVSKEEPGVQFDLNWLLELSASLTTLAGRYVAEDDTELAAVKEARSRLETAASPKTKYDAADRLVSKSTALIYTLGRMKLEARDERYSQTIKADIESRWLILGRNPYNEKASEFNDVLKKFPASMLGKLVSVKPLELFAP